MFFWFFCFCFVSLLFVLFLLVCLFVCLLFPLNFMLLRYFILTLSKKLMDRISTLNLHEHVIYPAIYQYGNGVGRDNRKSPKEDIIHFQYLIFPCIN